MNRNLKETRREKKKREGQIRVARSLTEALNHIEDLEAQLWAVKRLQNAHARHVIKPHFGTNTSEAVAVAVATDWHLGQIIRPETVMGKNEFDAAIGTRRVKSFFEKTVRLVRKERQDVRINELILFLGGDLIDGSLHEDSKMSQDITGPMEQAVLAQSLIETGINFLLEHGEFGRITVVCKDGNHGRITKKQHWGSRKGNALEWYMFYNLAQRFAGEKRLKWVLGGGIFDDVIVFGDRLRFHHGDTIHFGGINGPFTYINRTTMFWDKNHGQAMYTVQGHLHTHIPTRYWLVNGSLAGYNAYAVSLKGEFQPPIQGFFLWDKKRGPTVQIPILV